MESDDLPIFTAIHDYGETGDRSTMTFSAYEEHEDEILVIVGLRSRNKPEATLLHADQAEELRDWLTGWLIQQGADDGDST